MYGKYFVGNRKFAVMTLTGLEGRRERGGGEREEGGGHPFAPPNRPRFARPSIPVSVITANLRFPTKYLPYMKFTSPRL